MVFSRKEISKYIVVSAAAVIFGSAFWSCANIKGSIEGGPKDTLPPVVVRMNPEFNSTNINPKTVSIYFDEFIQLKDLQKEFFTSPFMTVRPTTMSKGKYIVTEIKSELDSATTYILNYGSAVVDNNESNPLVGLKYTFSTGAEIDSLYMTGLVLRAETMDTVPNAFIFFYDAAADSLPADSLVYKARALAVARTTPNGIFIHENLKPMDYRVYAMVDNNANQIYDPGVDEVAFMDTVYNPRNMTPFYMWYDTLVHYIIAEPQIFLMSFKENTDRRQNLSGFERIDARRVMLKFSSKNPVIEKLDFRGISPDSIIVEQTRETNDSTIYWFNMQPESIPDSLYADITYLRHDSVGNLYSHQQELRLIYVPPFVSPKEQRAQARADSTFVNEKKLERQARRLERKKMRQEKRRLRRLRKAGITDTSLVLDSLAMPSDSLLIAADSLQMTDSLAITDTLNIDTIPPSKMKLSLNASSPFVPDKDIVMSFDLPVTRFDSARVSLTQLHVQRQDTIRTNIPMTFRQDTFKIREYKLVTSHKWVPGDNYRLQIPAGALQTIDGEINDTITRTFAVAEMNKYANLIITIANANPEYEYILTVLDGGGNTVYKEIPHLKEGTHTVPYITPGKVMFKLTEDRNGNGKWDTGDLVKRIQPEKVEVLYDMMSKSREFTAKMDWDMEYTVDVEELFSPRVHTHDHPHGDGEDAVKVVGGTESVIHEDPEHDEAGEDSGAEDNESDEKPEANPDAAVRPDELDEDIVNEEAVEEGTDENVTE